MSRLGRYWTLWRTLPDDERRLRTGRLVERLLRQRPTIRRLGLAADPPGTRRLERSLRLPLSELVARLRRPDPRRGPLFGDLEPRARAIARNHTAHTRRIVETAGRILDGRLDLLGSGDERLPNPGGAVDWHIDWKSGLRWQEDAYYTDLVVVRGDGSDVKLPWELSRCQHLLVLGQAFQLAPHIDPEPQGLRTRCADMVRSQIDDWIRANPRGVGINWTCTMEVGIRAVTWLAVLGLLRDAEELDGAFYGRVVAALWMHGRHIRCNLEIATDGLTSNHYLADIVGLYALACGLPELDEAREWESFCRRSLEAEIERQVHPDGVDFEHSLPYHRLVTEMFLHAALLARAREADFGAEFHGRLARMLEFTACATREDHSVAQWGDNDDGRLLPLEGYATHEPQDHRHVLALGGRLLARDDLIAAGAGAEAEACWLLGPEQPVSPVPPAGQASRGFPDAGYYVMRAADMHCGISCAGVGTSGVGNHSHNDLLSVCVWAAGFEWISDPGTGCYTGDPELRNRMRSTAAHATLQLAHHEQNRLGEGLDGLFRLDECARPEVTEWQTDATSARLTARHRGFGTANFDWVHERSVVFDARLRSWVLRDLLVRESGTGPVSDPVYLRFPLCPEIACDLADSWPTELASQIAEPLPTPAAGTARSRFAARLSAGARTFWIGLDLPAGSRVELDAGLYSPRYGVTQPCPVLTATLPAAERTSALSVLWSPDGGSA